MADHRKLLTEIAARRRRNHLRSGMPRSGRFDLWTFRFQAIEAAHDALIANETLAEEIKTELLRHFPTAIFACLESYFRAALKDLIEAGVPFSERGCKLLDGKVHAGLLAHMHARQLELGDLIAHEVRLNNLADIDTIFSTLLNVKFLSYIEQVDLTQEPYSISAELAQALLLGWGNDYYAALTDLIEIRHIYCHEFAPSARLDHCKLLLVMVRLPSLVAVAEIVFLTAERRTELLRAGSHGHEDSGNTATSASADFE